MTTKEATVETVEEETPEVEEEHKGLSHLSPADRDAIIALRKENGEKRIRAKEAIAERDKLLAEKKELEEAKLMEDGKLKELLESKENELKELTPLKDKITSYEAYFQGQLEEHLKELPETQRELIESTDMDVAKKLEWCQKLKKEVNGLKPIPDGARPGGPAPDEKINMEDYQGPEGRRKLVNLSKTNRALYDAIVKMKAKT